MDNPSAFGGGGGMNPPGQNNQSGQSPPPNIGEGTGTNPPVNIPMWPEATNLPTDTMPRAMESAPQRTVQIRTMRSDVASIEKGEMTPTPENVMAPDSKKEIFFTPRTENQMPMPSMDTPPQFLNAEPPSRKKTWIIIIAIIVLGAVVWSGYYYVYPIFFPKTPVVTVEPPAPVLPTRASHRTYFVDAPEVQEALVLEDLSPLSISSAFTPIKNAGLVPGSFREVTIENPQTGQIDWSEYFAALTALPSTNLSSWFEKDFSAFIYYDDKGVWPGYVAKVKAGITADALKSGLTPLETMSLEYLFIFPPGAKSAEFKDGVVNGKTSRYSIFSLPGASFSYTIADPYVVFSTSYEGAKRAAARLGF